MRKNMFAVLGLLLAVPAQAAGHSEGEAADQALAVSEIRSVFNGLGYETQEHVDSYGNPHITVTSPPAEVVGMAVFLDDCGSAGCEEVTLYADMGMREAATLHFLNSWNYIGARLRSKAFRAGEAVDNPNGPVGLSLNLSMYDGGDAESLAELFRDFLFEVELFKAKTR